LLKTDLVITLALLWMLTACGTAPRVGRGGDVSTPLSAAQADAVTRHAVKLVGTPYRYGGNTPASGFDCSGLISYVYRTSAGVSTPRTVAGLNVWGQEVYGDQLRSGDIVLFAPRTAPTHAGIYVGSGRFVHAPSKGGEVRLENLSAKYWRAQHISFRRP